MMNKDQENNMIYEHTMFWVLLVGHGVYVLNPVWNPHLLVSYTAADVRFRSILKVCDTKLDQNHLYINTIFPICSNHPYNYLRESSEFRTNVIIYPLFAFEIKSFK